VDRPFLRRTHASTVRLLGKDWPKTLEEMEEWKRELRSGL